ncbi:hypothetical protein L873DRAFT_1345015 [Choiromyces venosus 120613-1]|uniref:Uncharacterized protein n=1 Tax=Choiromyces venosus 120613-1 TaxID=1336337 RepID=A0A3N4K4S8_9PEZI|nr:hypothetical protein L873DRAFT_1345015 [Choiromyces venosus 120613-1]
MNLSAHMASTNNPFKASLHPSAAPSCAAANPDFPRTPQSSPAPVHLWENPSPHNTLLSLHLRLQSMPTEPISPLYSLPHPSRTP